MGKQRRAKQERKARLRQFANGEGELYEDAVDQLMVNIHTAHMARAQRWTRRQELNNKFGSRGISLGMLTAAMSGLSALPSSVFKSQDKSKFF